MVQRAALPLWTISILWVFSLCGSPKQLKHIQAGDVLGFGKPFLGLCLIFHLMNPSDRFALVATLCTCVFQLGLLEISTGISTPKYLALLTNSRTSPCSMYCVSRGVLAVVTLMAWHLDGLNSISHLLSQACSLSRSLCKISTSFLFSIVMNMAVSSAKSVV